MRGENRYKPPDAEVADIVPEEPASAIARKPPRVVLVAGAFVTVSLLLAAVKVSFLTFWHSHILQVLSGCLYVLLAWFAMSSVYKARNWVRWGMVLLGARSFLGLMLGLPEGMPFPTFALHIVQGLLLGAASVLFLLPGSRQWFVRCARGDHAD